MFTSLFMKIWIRFVPNGRKWIGECPRPLTSTTDCVVADFCSILFWIVICCIWKEFRQSVQEIARKSSYPWFTTINFEQPWSPRSDSKKTIGRNIGVIVELGHEENNNLNRKFSIAFHLYTVRNSAMQIAHQIFTKLSPSLVQVRPEGIRPIVPEQCPQATVYHIRSDSFRRN